MTISSALDKVRLEIGDRNMDRPLFADDEIEYYLDKRNGDVLLAAADCCDSLATRFAADIDFDTDTLAIKKLQRSEAMAKRAEALRARAFGFEEVVTTVVDGYSQDLDALDTTLITSASVDPDIPRYGPSWKSDLERQTGEHFTGG